MSEHDDDLAEFLADVKVRRPKAEVPAQAAPEAGGSGMSPEEANTTNALLGFAFKCSVCLRHHRSGAVGFLKVLDKCIAKAFTGATGELVPREEPKDFVSSSTVFGNYDEREWFPTDLFWTVSHPAIMAEKEAADEVLSDTLRRKVTTSVPVMEVLSAPNLNAAIQQYKQRHYDECASITKSLRREVIELYAPIKAQVRDWRTMPVDGVTIDTKDFRKIERAFSATSIRGIHPIARVKINGRYREAGLILSCFQLAQPQNPIDTMSDRVQFELYDIGWRDGDLAVLYAHSAYGGSRRKPKLRYRTFFLSTRKRHVYHVTNVYQATVTGVEVEKFSNS